ncbi:unnamed protein product [Triticum turgidum subsp. durum]|uniref:RING-type E3 ubiquitin transferase n=1 Tax=Triticum turgidum subsp. durum TaxID=4567 RepID=A0A9R0YCE2_TRITD|nr:unnamed protein product [Triticum turgidum subsp. durum]
MMARNSDGELEEQSTEGYQEAAFEAFICPLTKQVMQDPVTIETGQTFEREAILKWFRECRDNGRRPTCPLTQRELRTTDINPSIALRNVIDEWRARNDEKDLEKACNALRMHPEDDEDDTLRAMAYISQICQRSGAKKNLVRAQGIISTLADLLKSSSRRVRLKSLQVLRTVVEDNDQNKEELGKGDTVRTIIKFLSNEHIQERELAVSLLYELSEYEPVCVRIGAIYGAILLLVGMGSSKSENMMAVEKAEKTLKAMREMSSNELSAKILLQAGILPPLVKDLFSVGASSHFPMRLKEVSATILANLVASGASFRSIPLDDAGRQTLLSEDVVHGLLHLISNTGPAVECKLLNVLVGLTSSPDTAQDVVSAIKSSGATISLIQFLEAAHREIRVESLKLLRNVSPYMGAELADALGGHLSSLLRVISDAGGGGVTEEQAAAVGLLGDLPERDSKLTRQLFELGAFGTLSTKLAELRRGAIRGNRYTTPLTEGMVKVMYRLTCMLQEAPEYVEFAREAALAPLFVELVQVNGQDAVQLYSAMALEKLSLETRNLTVIPDPPPPAPSGGFLCACFGVPSSTGAAAGRPVGVCRVHGGFCSLRESFCLAEGGAGGKAVERLVACLDHLNPEVVEAALAALATLVGDGVEAAEGVGVLGDADGLRPVVDILVENRTEALRRRAVWVVERILRVEDIAQEVAADQTVASALVEAYRNGDPRTRHTAERALRHLDRIPNFSSAFHAQARRP